MRSAQEENITSLFYFKDNQRRIELGELIVHEIDFFFLGLLSNIKT